jgi:hypothetical protein
MLLTLLVWYGSSVIAIRSLPFRLPLLLRRPEPLSAVSTATLPRTVMEPRPSW